MIIIYILGLLLLFMDPKKIFVILFSVEVMSFGVILFFSMNLKFMFMLILLLIVSSGLILTLMSLQHIYFFSKNKMISFIK